MISAQDIPELIKKIELIKLTLVPAPVATEDITPTVSTGYESIPTDDGGSEGHTDGTEPGGAQRGHRLTRLSCPPAPLATCLANDTHQHQMNMPHIIQRAGGHSCDMMRWEGRWGAW